MTQNIIGTVQKFFPTPDRCYGFVEIPGQTENVFFHLKGGYKAWYDRKTDTVRIEYQKPERNPVQGDRIQILEIERRGKGMQAQWLFAESFERALMLRELLVPVSQGDSKKPLTIELAQALLSHCHRDTLEDRAFGDSEVSWRFNGRIIASGYFGNSGSSVSFNTTAVYSTTSFEGEDARRLRHAGKAGNYARNDEGGSDCDFDPTEDCDTILDGFYDD